jgi:hypothetical protein
MSHDALGPTGEDWMAGLVRTYRLESEMLKN